MPRRQPASKRRLVRMPGEPRVTTGPPAGGPLAERGGDTTGRGVAQGPPLTRLGEDHQVACHRPVGTPAAAAALAANAARGHTATGLEIHQSGLPVGAVVDGPGERA